MRTHFFGKSSSADEENIDNDDEDDDGDEEVWVLNEIQSKDQKTPGVFPQSNRHKELIRSLEKIVRNEMKPEFEVSPALAAQRRKLHDILRNYISQFATK